MGIPIVRTRCSSLPRFLECASSQQETAAPYDPGSDPAELGTAVHEGLAQYVRDGSIPDFIELSKRYEQPVKELRMLFFNGRKAWEAIKEQLPEPRVEQKVSSRLTMGTADVVFHNGQVCIIVDWKSGYVQSNYRNQLCGYAYAAVETFGMPASGQISIVTVWLRAGEIDTEILEASDLAKWEVKYEKQAERVGSQYSPGEWCIGCRRQLNCQAREEFIRSAAVSLSELEPDATGEALIVSRETLGLLHPRAKLLENALSQYRAAFRLDIQLNGPMQISETKQMELREYTKDLVDPLKAWPVMKRFGFSDNELNAVISFRKTKAMDIVAGKAGHGGKKLAKEDCLQQLKDAGAVTEVGYTKLVPVKLTKEIADGKVRQAS